ncbi:MAG: hypothetical protein ABSB25_09780 [Sedimentisphaerales bacterium]|jgi:hypothetical protein
MRKKLWLCVPFAALCVVDFGLTLAGQSPAYWQGNYSAVGEWFPLFALVLRHGPILFLFMSLLWIFVFSTLIVVLPDIFSQILSLTLVIGNTCGALTWLAFRFRFNPLLCMLLFVLSAAIFIITQARWRMTQPAHAAERASPTVLHPPKCVR